MSYYWCTDHNRVETDKDVCPANRVLNLLAAQAGKEYDEGGQMASAGIVNVELLNELNDFPYYKKSYPKSLANDFGTDELYPVIKKAGLPLNDALRTMVEHIVFQIRKSIRENGVRNQKILVTGGGAFNSFMIQRLGEELASLEIEVVVPEPGIVQYKEALVMALIGVLRWRQEYNVLSSVTGAERDSIGGAVWIGQEG